MDIEVKHDPLNLPAKALIKVRNHKLAEIRLDRFTFDKYERGYRLRYIADNKTNTVELGARRHSDLYMAIRCLKDCGLYVRKEPWHTNRLLNS